MYFAKAAPIPVQNAILMSVKGRFIPNHAKVTLSSLPTTRGRRKLVDVGVHLFIFGNVPAKTAALVFRITVH
jgi:hypothetical protein